MSPPGRATRCSGLRAPGWYPCPVKPPDAQQLPSSAPVTGWERPRLPVSPHQPLAPGDLGAPCRRTLGAAPAPRWETEARRDASDSSRAPCPQAWGPRLSVPAAPPNVTPSPHFRVDPLPADRQTDTSPHHHGVPQIQPRSRSSPGVPQRRSHRPPARVWGPRAALGSRAPVSPLPKGGFPPRLGAAPLFQSRNLGLSFERRLGCGEPGGQHPQTR